MGFSDDPRSGYVEAWGQGIAKILRECKEAGLPPPIIEFLGSDVKTVFRKDIYNEEYLKTLGISDRQIKALLFSKANGKITNAEHQAICKVSRETASRDIRGLVEAKILISNDKRGAGAIYHFR